MTQVLAVRTMGAAGIANQDLAELIVHEAPDESLILIGGRARIRTGDLRIKSPLLCRLSYAPLTPRNIGRNIGLGPEPVNSRRRRLAGATAPVTPPQFQPSLSGAVCPAIGGASPGARTICQAPAPFGQAA